MSKKFRVVYTSAAKEETRESKKWYNEQKKGLGKYFAREINIAIEKIRNNPEFASVKYDV